VTHLLLEGLQLCCRVVICQWDRHKEVEVQHLAVYDAVYQQLQTHTGAADGLLAAAPYNERPLLLLLLLGWVLLVVPARRASCSTSSHNQFAMTLFW
jgi:hypothetical protein